MIMAYIEPGSPREMLGSTLVIAADLGGRVLFAPFELPAGILMAAIGTPFFLFPLIKGRFQDA